MRRDAKQIPEHIAELMRKQHIYSLQQLAQVSGLHKSRLYYGVSKGRFSEKSAQVLARALKCDPEDLGKVVDNRSMAQNDQLCWDCIHAVPDGKHGCSWSRSFKPVEGWTATESIKADFDTYKVSKCPKFKEG